MIDGKFVLGLILARGGSKRLPGKNILPLGGKPMIDWTVEAGLSCKMIDRLVLSTDDLDIASTAEAAGCDVPFRRPVELAEDTTSSAEAALHALDALELDEGYLVLLQPTSPFRSADDIDGCVETLHKSGEVSCASVCQLEYPANWLMTLDEVGRITPPFEGEAPQLYRPNGAVYVVDVAWFRAHQKFWVEGVTLAYETPASRSLDIDTKEDFQLAEFLIGQ